MAIRSKCYYTVEALLKHPNIKVDEGAVELAVEYDHSIAELLLNHKSLKISSQKRISDLIS